MQDFVHQQYYARIKPRVLIGAPRPASVLGGFFVMAVGIKVFPSIILVAWTAVAKKA